MTGVPVGVSEAPGFSGVVLEAEEETLLGGGVAGDGEVPLGVLLRDHQPVQLSHVRWGQRLLEHRFFVVFGAVVFFVEVEGVERGRGVCVYELPELVVVVLELRRGGRFRCVVIHGFCFS